MIASITLPPHPPQPFPQVRKTEKDPEWDYDPALARRNIHVKRFIDVPMADVEMIFPDKSIWLKPVLLIQLVVTIVGGIVAAIASLRSESGVSPKLLLAALTLVGGRAAAVYSQAAAARQAVADAITRRLYDSTMGAQEADILLLLDEMADQVPARAREGRGRGEHIRIDIKKQKTITPPLPPPPLRPLPLPSLTSTPRKPSSPTSCCWPRAGA